jgi:hypothetical protein
MKDLADLEKRESAGRGEGNGDKDGGDDQMDIEVAGGHKRIRDDEGIDNAMDTDYMNKRIRLG